MSTTATTRTATAVTPTPTSTRGARDTTALIDAHGLTKTFGTHTVLHEVDLQVQQGRLARPRGAHHGRELALLHSLSGMDTITAGSVRFHGHDLPALRQKQLARLRLTTMGFVFQQVHLLKNLCLLDNVVLPAYLAGLAPRKELNRRATDLMERLGVAELAGRDVSEASGGQLQRVGICRALINEPMIIFGDEPTGALNSTAAAEVMDIIGELNAEGTTVMLVTHDAKVAARADRVLYMVDGRIIGDRDQRRSAGTDLHRREAELTKWLLARGF
jgi:putative ABC transport system ATP-binding protein